MSNSSGKEMGLPSYQMRKSIAFNKGKEDRRYINAEFIGKIMWSVSMSFESCWKTDPKRIFVPTPLSGSQFASTVCMLVTLIQ